MKQHRATLGIVFLIVFIDLVGFGIVIPILPLYADLYHPSPLVFGLFMASFSIMQFIFAPILGRLSDRFGRRPVLAVSMCGSVVGYLMFGFAGSFWVLFLSRVIDGISGGNISTAQAVMADITAPDERAKAMGFIGAAFGLGFILGPAIGGTLVQFAMWLPGVAAAAMSALAFVLVVVRLPETRKKGDRPSTRRRPFDLTLLRRTLSSRQLTLCMAQILIIIFAFANFETTFAQFARARHSLTIAQISYLFVFAGVVGAIVQGGLVGRLVQRFGEARLIVVGSILAAAAMASIPYAGRVAPMMVGLAVLAVGHGILAPSLSSLTSQLADPAEVGGVMGQYQSLSSFGRIIGPFWGEWAFGTYGIGSPFLSAAGSYALATVLGVMLLVALSATRSPAAQELKRASPK